MSPSDVFEVRKSVVYRLPFRRLAKCQGNRVIVSTSRQTKPMSGCPYRTDANSFVQACLTPCVILTESLLAFDPSHQRNHVADFVTVKSGHRRNVMDTVN